MPKKNPWDDLPDAEPVAPKPWDALPDAAVPVAPVESTAPTGAPPAQESVNPLISALRGGAQGLSFGFADELAGGLGALQDLGSDLPFAERYRRERDASRAAYEAAQRANPKSYLAGELGGGLATALLPGGAAAQGAKAATLGAKVGRGLATGLGLGALSGAGASQADLTQGEVLETLKNMGTNAAIGGTLGAGAPAAGAAAGAIGRAAKKAAPEWALDAAGAIQHNLQALTKEKQAELGQWLLDRSLVKPFSGKDAILERIQGVKAQEGPKIGAELAKATQPFEAEGTKWKAVAQLLGLSGEDILAQRPAMQKALKALELNEEMGKTSLSEINALKSAMQKGTNYAANAKERAANEAKKAFAGILRSDVDEQLAKQISPEDFARYVDAKTEYGRARDLLPIITKGSNREGGNAFIGPTGLAAGSAATVASGNPIIGAASALLSKLGKERGSAAMAVLTDRMGKSAIPGVLEEYAPAAGRYGGAAGRQALAEALGGASPLALWLASQDEAAP